MLDNAILSFEWDRHYFHAYENSIDAQKKVCIWLDSNLEPSFDDPGVGPNVYVHINKFHLKSFKNDFKILGSFLE